MAYRWEGEGCDHLPTSYHLDHQHNDQHETQVANVGSSDDVSDLCQSVVRVTGWNSSPKEAPYTENDFGTPKPGRLSGTGTEEGRVLSHTVDSSEPWLGSNLDGIIIHPYPGHPSHSSQDEGDIADIHTPAESGYTHHHTPRKIGCTHTHKLTESG
ncbi:hypothetical protein Pmani_015497 [Petrolisthes manimaculis]|uniref:Uncharacterized protein n=1 Tax=Petrolisthes manimaculis TaxID=1843537 RepID=A0AAE1PUB1_9EUCA|nr:hypothetical protein Pmani_015497 [Petrolisthes manimaculis]